MSPEEMGAYKLPEGTITISCSDEELSIGTLRLNPGEELDRHSRPVNEKLLQIKGTGGLRIFDEDGPREVILKEGDRFEIPADLEHQHINPGESESVVSWRFDGDITDIISDIRSDFDRL